MKIRFIGRFIAAGFFSGLLLSGCSRRDEKTVGTPENPLVLVFSPAHAPAASPGALDIIKKHLEKETGMTVDLKVAPTPGETVNSFKAGRTDAALVTLEEYLVAREEYGVHAELQVLRGYKLADYEGALLTRSAGGAASVAELNGKKIGFVGPYSVSGFTLPAIYLEKAGVKAVFDFSTGHAANLKKLVDGEVFAAATYARQASRFPGVKVLAYTGKVPNEPVIVRRGLSPEKRKALTAAFITMGSTAEVQRILGSVADITGFRPVDEAVYRPLHDLILSEKRSVYDLVPDGWEIYRLNQPYYPD
jgi:phosphonate transport system substrate-binding protein